MPRVLHLPRESRRLPPLLSATALIYALSAAAMLVATIWYDEGKNPRWVLGVLSLIAAVFAVVALARGGRFSTLEATVMLAVCLGTLASLTWTSRLELAAFGNGLALPLLGTYASWLLPRRAALVFYCGLAAWAGSVIHHGNHVLSTMALLVAGQAVVMTEIVRILVVRISRLMYTDPLTGALNRAGLHRSAEHLIDEARRHGTDLSVALIDLDGLREINNTDGHPAGDSLLVRAAEEWLAAFPQDVVARLGGDEFVVVFPGIASAEADERLAQARARTTVSWTWGVAHLKPGDTFSTLIERADRRMYDGKGDHL